MDIFCLESYSLISSSRDDFDCLNLNKWNIKISLCLKPSIGGRSIGVWRDSMNLREFLTLSRPSYSHRHQHHQFHHHQQQQQWYHHHHHHHHHYHRNHHNENSLHAEILFKAQEDMLSLQMNYSVNQVLSIFIHYNQFSSNIIKLKLM